MVDGKEKFQVNWKFKLFDQSLPHQLIKCTSKDKEIKMRCIKIVLAKPILSKVGKLSLEFKG